MKSAKPGDAKYGFTEMLSSLSDAEAAPLANPAAGTDDSGREVIATGGISRVFPGLPDAEPAAAQSQTSKRCDEGTSPGRQGPRSVQSRSPMRDRRPVAIPFGAQANSPVESASPAPTRRPANNPAAPARGGDDNLAGEIDPRTITQQILEHLEQYKLLATCQLRIEVHNRVVVAVGDVPGPYEKQLVAHFCRQVPGVEKFVDGMHVREMKAQKSAKRRARARRPSVEWRLPFRAWHGGAALGLVVVVWGAMSLGRGSSGPERLPVYPVAGTVTFAGKPAAGAAVFLHSVDGSIPVRPRPAVVSADGTFAVGTYEFDDGVPAGDYKLTVEWRRPIGGGGARDDEVPPNVLPPAYASPATTPVQVTVEEGENEIPPITFQN
jgi:hypothetical protein